MPAVIHRVNNCEHHCRVSSSCALPVSGLRARAPLSHLKDLLSRRVSTSAQLGSASLYKCSNGFIGEGWFSRVEREWAVLVRRTPSLAALHPEVVPSCWNCGVSISRGSYFFGKLLDHSLQADCHSLTASPHLPLAVIRTPPSG